MKTAMRSFLKTGSELKVIRYKRYRPLKNKSLSLPPLRLRFPRSNAAFTSSPPTEFVMYDH